MFFKQMDINGDGVVQCNELVEFLQRVANPISMEEEHTEAFRFFEPSFVTTPGAANETMDPRQAMITKSGLVKIFKDMGEDLTEAECEEMIIAATGGAAEIDFSTFQRF